MPVSVSTGSLGEPRAKRCKHCDGKATLWCVMVGGPDVVTHPQNTNVFTLLTCLTRHVQLILITCLDGLFKWLYFAFDVCECGPSVRNRISEMK